MDTYLAFKKRYAFLQHDFSKTLNVLKTHLGSTNNNKIDKTLLDNIEILNHYLSIISSKLVDIEECVVNGKNNKTPDDLKLLENYRENSEIIEKMKPLMFLLKLQEMDKN